MKWKSLALLFFPMLVWAVEVSDIRTYRNAGDNIIINQSFDNMRRWRRLPGYTRAAGEGTNGTTALKLDRTTPPDVRVDYCIQLPQLTAGARYEVSFMVKSADIRRISGNNRLTVGGIEHTQNGNTIYVEYPTYVPSGEYTEVKFSFLARENMGAQLTLNLNSHYSGTVWFDDVVVRAAGPDYSSRLLWPQNLTFRYGETDFRVHINDDAPEHMMVYVKLEQEGHTEELLLNRRELAGKFSRMLPGKGKLTLSIIDPQAKMIMATNEYQINILPADQKAPDYAITIDRHGRLIVDGKPFMPLGVYGLFHEPNLRRIADAGFNCVLVYPSFSMYGARKTGNQLADIRAGLDNFAKYGLKMIFAFNQQLPGYSQGCTELDGTKGAIPVAVRIAQEFASHPALLGYYLSDEVSRHTIPHVQSLREAVNGADPWHPTYTITYRMQDLPLYGISGDIIGVDPYPIKPTDTKPTLDPIITYMRGAQSTGMPIWAIPQIFNWAIYDAQYKNDPAKFATTRGPNRKEMLAMPLLCAIMGAKGFIFYSEVGITFHAEKILPGITERVWPDVKFMAQEMRRLAPYILGTEPAPEVRVTGTDRVMAKAFKADDGKIAVFIVALGPDPVTAQIEITLPDGVQLKSRTGLTEFKDGKFVFTAQGIDSDILEVAE